MQEIQNIYSDFITAFFMAVLKEKNISEKTHIGNTGQGKSMRPILYSYQDINKIVYN